MYLKMSLFGKSLDLVETLYLRTQVSYKKKKTVPNFMGRILLFLFLFCNNHMGYVTQPYGPDDKSNMS